MDAAGQEKGALAWTEEAKVCSALALDLSFCHDRCSIC